MAGFLVYCAVTIPAAIIFDRRIGIHGPTVRLLLAIIIVAEVAKAVVGGF